MILGGRMILYFTGNLKSNLVNESPPFSVSQYTHSFEPSPSYSERVQYRQATQCIATLRQRMSLKARKRLGLLVRQSLIKKKVSTECHFKSLERRKNLASQGTRRKTKQSGVLITKFIIAVKPAISRSVLNDLQSAV